MSPCRFRSRWSCDSLNPHPGIDFHTTLCVLDMVPKQGKPALANGCTCTDSDLGLPPFWGTEGPVGPQAFGGGCRSPAQGSSWLRCQGTNSPVHQGSALETSMAQKSHSMLMVWRPWHWPVHCCPPSAYSTIATLRVLAGRPRSTAAPRTVLEGRTGT